VIVRNFILIGIFFLALPQFCFCQVFNNPDQAFLAALQSKRPVLLIFSGSDWCLPCDRLNRVILSDSTFKNFAGQKLVLVEADFPQKSKLPQEQILWNEKLAEAFNPNGIFPYLLLLNADKTIITALDYIHYDSAHFIEEINNAITISGK
jgi:thiol-disulfide isomerase/thioredoxin